jgi:hypothetical protein
MHPADATPLSDAMTDSRHAVTRATPVAAFVLFLVITLGGLCVLLVGFMSNWLGQMLG